MPSAAVGLSALLSIAAASTGDTARPRLLDVPYVSQTRALCGGAAAAMVLRYWGERGVYAEDFAEWVDGSREGIPTESLIAALRGRGFSATPLRGDLELARRRLAEGQPLLVLLEDEPGRYHYVVLIGSLPGRLVIHDPARAPDRLVDEEAFRAAWAAADYWSLLVLPSGEEELESSEESASPSHAAGDGCSAMVDEAVRLSRLGESTAAEEILEGARQLCSHASAPLRELAGIRFLQSRWQEAEELAERAVALDPNDHHAWRTLAASRFLRDDAEGALPAWNQIEEPRIDLVRVDGLTRTRYEVVAKVLDLPPGELLTVEHFELARRRLSALPAGVGSRLGYRPVGRGMAEVEAAIVERSLWPGSRTELLAKGIDAAFEREVSLELSSPTGGGELWSGSFRFWDERPKVSLALSVPRPWRLPGIWRVEGSWERQSYAEAGSSAVAREDRRRASLSVTDWWTAGSRWELRTGLDHWQEWGRYVFVGGGIERRLAEDRLALRVEGTGWMGLSPSQTFGTASFGSSFRSSAAERGLVGRAGVQWSSTSAPLDLSPGAGTGHARAPLLRAHPLLDEGVITGEAFGRTLVHGGIEYPAWLATKGLLRFGVSFFADVAKAYRPLSVGASALHVDVGAGIRLRPIGERRTVRIDTAWGLSDGEFAISAGWVLPWPDWP